MGIEVNRKYKKNLFFIFTFKFTKSEFTGFGESDISECIFWSFNFSFQSIKKLKIFSFCFWKQSGCGHLRERQMLYCQFDQQCCFNFLMFQLSIKNRKRLFWNFQHNHVQDNPNYNHVKSGVKWNHKWYNVIWPYFPYFSKTVGYIQIMVYCNLSLLSL